MKHFTWQDFQQAENPMEALRAAIRDYRCSAAFRNALEADAYFSGRNTEVARKTILRARKLETVDASGRRRVRCEMNDVAGNRISSGFLFRFICQQNSYLLQNGCIVSAEARKMLGSDFDRALIALGERALLHGTAWGFWNMDHLEIMAAAEDRLSGFMPLYDEFSGEMMGGAQFWQLSPQRMMYIRLFEPDGVSILQCMPGGQVSIREKKRVYRMSRRTDMTGNNVTEDGNWPRLPVFALHANAARTSEFTPSIKTKIDAYDRILSDFADNLDRANDVYWVLNNFGGTSEDVIEMLTEINRIKAVANISDGTGGGSTAEPHTIEVPFAARQAALTLLERALYADYMAMNMEAISRGSMTNVAIKAVYADLDLKSTHYEWEVAAFMHALLSMLGCDDTSVRFNRQRIINEGEIVQSISLMREDIDRAAALRLNPLLETSEMERLLAADDAIPEAEK